MGNQRIMPVLYLPSTQMNGPGISNGTESEIRNS